MDRIKVLRQKKADLAREARQLVDQATAAGRDLTAEEITKRDALLSQLEATSQEIAAEERLMDAERAIAAAPLPNAAPVAEQRERAAVQVAVRDRAEDDPKRGFRDHREYLLAVMGAGRGARVDDRLKPLFRAAAGSDEQGGYSDPHGGFLLPVAFSPDVLSIQSEADPTAGRVMPVPMTAPMVKVNARVDKNHTSSVSGGLQVYRHSETTAITPTRMSMEQIDLTAEELIGAAYATESILTDSPVSFVAILSAGFRDEFSAKILKEKLTGTGSGGQYLGVLNSPCLVTVAKEVGQDARTLLVENIDKMAARCWRYGQAIWLANHDARPQLRALARVIGTGGQVAPYFTESNGQEYLDGKPIFFTEFAKTIGTVGDLILGNWREYLEGTYQTVQQAESIHVRFLNHERTFKFWVRNCGQPWWRSAMTPAESTDTLSPFVVLASR